MFINDLDNILNFKTPTFCNEISFFKAFKMLILVNMHRNYDINLFYK